MKTILHSVIGISCVVASLAARAQAPALLTTFANPTPEDGRFFSSVCFHNTAMSVFSRNWRMCN